MSLVVALTDDYQTIMRADWLVSAEDDDGVVPLGAFPKIAILAPDLAVGMAGADPIGGFENLIKMWKQSPTPSGLRGSIEEDGDLRRDWITLEASGAIWTYADGSWRQSDIGIGWIGDKAARSKIDPDPFDFDITKAPTEVQEQSAARARSRGWDEESIQATLDPATSAQIGAEAAFGNATRSGVPTVAGPALEARLVDGRFTFNKQSRTVLPLGGPKIETTAHASAALAGNGMFSHWMRSRCGHTFPAQLVVDFDDSGKSLAFWLDEDAGYQCWFGDTVEVPPCGHPSGQ